jgi:hypothetical protein
MVPRHAVLFGLAMILWFSPQGSHAQKSPAFSDYEYYMTEDGAFGLYKPKAWKVSTQRYPNGRMVVANDPEELSCASMLFLEKIDPNQDSVAFAAATLKNVSRQLPDLKLLESGSSNDRMHTFVKYQRRGPNRVPIEGRYSFNVQRPNAVVHGYEAPAKQFKEMIPTLLTVIANITLLDDQAYQRLLSQQKDPKSTALPMKKGSASDGTCSLLVPEGWNLAAAKGSALCASPDGDTGFIFSFIEFVGQSRMPNFNSASIPGNLRYEYMPPADALMVASKHLGSNNHRILERHPNPAWAMQATALLKRQSDAEIALISYGSKNGTPCVGYFDVLGLRPTNTGQWGIMPLGFWAPGSKFAQQLPSLIKIAESFQINQQWAAEQVRQGMEKVKELMKKTSSMMSKYAEEMRQNNLAGHQNRMKSSDFTSYKFSTYMRGEQEWVTGMEGGKIYKTDHWGLSSGGQTVIEGPSFNYYNYQGEARGHIPVDSSREVFEAVKGSP